MANLFYPLQPTDLRDHRERYLPLELSALAACADLSDPHNQKVWKDAIARDTMLGLGSLMFVDDSKSDANAQAKIAQADQAVGMVAGKAEVDDSDIGLLTQNASLGGSMLARELAYAEARVQGTLSRAHGMKDAARRARELGFKDGSPQKFGSAAAIDYEMKRRSEQSSAA